MDKCVLKGKNIKKNPHLTVNITAKIRASHDLDTMHFKEIAICTKHCTV